MKGTSVAHAASFVAVLLLALLSIPALAVDPERRVEFDIPAQPLSSAVVAFSRQAGVQVVASSKDLEGISSVAVKGRYSLREAVQRMLESSGLSAAFNGENAVAIKRVNDASGKTSSGNSDLERYVSQKIEVTGSRLKSAQEGAQPTVVITRDAIDRTGAANINELLRVIPQASTNLVAGTVFVEGGAATVNLRGIPNGATLVLVNGRRVGTSGHTFARDSFDLNSIPLAAIERIEVLSNSASAIYGADALAGVINVILRRNVEGSIFEASYGGATDGAYDEGHLGATLGVTHSKFHGTLAVVGYRDPPKTDDAQRVRAGWFSGHCRDREIAQRTPVPFR